jgi:hypothetical protein
MPAMKHQHKLSSAAIAHLNELLDEALKQTFPASDPVAINVEFELLEDRTPTLKFSTAPRDIGKTFQTA